MKTNPHTCPTNDVRVLAIGIITALLLSAVVRVHGQTTTAPSIGLTGVYTLTSVDGKTVPCMIDHEGTAMNVQSGSFTITNGHCLSVMTVSVGDRKDIRCETRARYTVEGSELTMQWQNAGMTKGSVAGNTFTMTNEGMAYVYNK